MEVHIVEPLRAGHGLERLHLELAQVFPRAAATRPRECDCQQGDQKDFWMSLHDAYPRAERRRAWPDNPRVPYAASLPSESPHDCPRSPCLGPRPALAPWTLPTRALAMGRPAPRRDRRLGRVPSAR